MQNFKILVINDKELLEKIGNIKSQISEEFIRENYQQLSFSEEELLQKKVGILGAMFPPSWRDPAKLDEAIRESAPSFLKETIKDSPVVLIVIYDSRKRAPASEGDVLGIMNLGCIMENMWLMAQSLGVSFQIMSVFSSNCISANDVEKEIKRILNISKYMKIAFALRLGYPISAPAKYPRVRRDVEAFTNYNSFGKNGLKRE